MKIVLKKDTGIAGEGCGLGSVVEVGEREGKHLVGSGRAVKAKPSDKLKKLPVGGSKSGASSSSGKSVDAKDLKKLSDALEVSTEEVKKLTGEVGDLGEQNQELTDKLEASEKEVEELTKKLGESAK